MTGRLGRHHLALPVALVVGLGCIVPIGVLFVFSVFTVEDFDLIPDVSPRAWIELVTQPTYAYLIGKALLSGTVTAAVTAIIGYPVALALARLPVSLKGVAVVMLLTPLYTGEIVRIYAWRLVLGSEGLINALLEALGLIHEPIKILLFSPLTTGIVLAYNNLPFMVLAIWVSAEMVDRRLVEAARDLGARPIEAFFKIVLPLTAPGLAAGIFAVFALAAGEMLTPSLLGGTSGATAMAMIDSLFGTAFDWPMASALALGLLTALFTVATAVAVFILRLKGARAVLAKAPT